MKSLFLIFALVLGCSLAKAGTITLSSTACTATNICYDVQNDAGKTIDYLNYSAHYGRLLVSMDGVIYDSGLGSASSSLQNVPLYSPYGESVIYVTVDFSQVHKPCVRSGRVTVCPVVITLTSGTIQE